MGLGEGPSPWKLEGLQGRACSTPLVLAGNGAQIDTTTMAGRLVFGIFAAPAEFSGGELIRVSTRGEAGRVGLDPSAWPAGRR